MKGKKIGIGIIGCGRVSKDHLAAFLELNNDCTIKAVADRNLDHAKMLIKDAPEKIDIYDDIISLLKRDDIDLVSICTPPYLHKEQVLQAFAHGKHVICEKPFASSLDDCDAMIEGAKQFNKELCITHQLRFGRDINRIKHVINSGELGDIVFAQLQGLYWRGDSYYKNGWRGTWEEEGGGVLMTLAIHPLDLLIDVLGPVKSVSAEMDTIAHKIEVEDYITATLEFKNGVKANLLATTNSVENDVKIRFSGKTKAIQWPLAYHATFDTNDGFSSADQQGIEILKDKAHECTSGRDDHFASLSDMISAIKENRHPIITGIEARKVIEVITGIYKSATLKKVIHFPIDRNDPWYTKQGILQHVKRHKRGE